MGPMELGYKLARKKIFVNIQDFLDEKSVELIAWLMVNVILRKFLITLGLLKSRTQIEREKGTFNGTSIKQEY